jgi:hypothetical protein
MASITFKAKIQAIKQQDGAVAYQYVTVPRLERKHCDMSAFRSHPVFGALANSDLFPGILSRIRAELIGGGLGLRMDKLPSNVSVNDTGFLAVITVTV